MAIIHLVRHGKAAAGFAGHPDPGLDETGQQQAEATARALAPLGPMTVYSSPLARALQTAEPLIARWSMERVIEPRVAEIPSPSEDLEARGEWLREFMQGRWSAQPEDLQTWRDALLRYLLEQREDCVIFSHFIAINAAVGAAHHDDRVVVFRPDNGSLTRITNADGRIRVIELGREARSQVL